MFHSLAASLPLLQLRYLVMAWRQTWVIFKNVWASIAVWRATSAECLSKYKHLIWLMKSTAQTWPARATNLAWVIIEVDMFLREWNYFGLIWFLIQVIVSFLSESNRCSLCSCSPGHCLWEGIGYCQIIILMSSFDFHLQSSWETERFALEWKCILFLYLKVLHLLELKSNLFELYSFGVNPLH